MPAGQQEVYFLTGESRPLIESSPHLEAFKAKGFEVLFLSDPVDGFVMQSLGEFGGKKLRSAADATLDLGGAEDREQAAAQRKEREAGFAELLAALQKQLDAHVKEVRLSSRLTASPVCLVGDGSVNPRLERLLSGKRGAGPRRILELNPEHALVQQLKARFEKDKADARVGDYAELLLGQALLAEGSDLPEPARFAQLVSDLMVRSLA
jgi:molecular chaperone HtpG